MPSILGSSILGSDLILKRYYILLVLLAAVDIVVLWPIVNWPFPGSDHFHGDRSEITPPARVVAERSMLCLSSTQR